MSLMSIRVVLGFVLIVTSFCAQQAVAQVGTFMAPSVIIAGKNFVLAPGADQFMSEVKVRGWTSEPSIFRVKRFIGV